ncbi:L,D-transpeptidase family protein [uncultured Vibrio sp.]|uniref:L,D-transpeptidase family protein n=1 Tax=uncultured Vibrio sp. TaxID=114054 RepID=UPI002635EA60|nr:L,D-transpeptidase family protein [uncultured Vibrio sp.]
MRLFWVLSMWLFSALFAYADKLVVEKIVSDATAIESIVLESAPSSSRHEAVAINDPMSAASLTSKHVVVEGDTAIEGDSNPEVAQLSQRPTQQPQRPSQGSSIQPFIESNAFSDLEPSRQVVTLVKVDKSKRRMYLLKGDEVIQEYRIALGKEPKGHKRFEGDKRTPEGKYRLDYIMEESEFYRSVHIDYPRPSDKRWAEKNKVDPGGNIKVHGIRNGEWRSPDFIQSFDWTDGCIALTNQDMDEFIELVKMGTPIHIEW